MKPEEKAEELYTFFDNLTSTQLTVAGDITDDHLTDFAKDCATGCANTVIMAIGTLRPDSNKSIEQKKQLLDYWVQVWNELKNYTHKVV